MKNLGKHEIVGFSFNRPELKARTGTVGTAVATGTRGALRARMAQAQPNPAINPLTMVELKTALDDVITEHSGKSLKPYNDRISADAEEFVENYADYSRRKNWDDAQRNERFDGYSEDQGLLWFKLHVKEAAVPPPD